VPNTTKGKFSPTASVGRAASNLKLGDTIRVGYSSLAGRTKVTGVSQSGSRTRSKSGEAGGSGSFVFVSSRKTKTSRGSYLTVMARKGSMMWTFKAALPAEDPARAYSHSTEKTGIKASASNSDTGLAAQAAAFKPGDIVALDYSTVNFQFVLKGITPFKMSAQGRLVRVGKRTVRGKAHDFALISTPKRSLSLLVPAVEDDDGKIASDPGILAGLTAIKLRQAVQVTYRRQGGVLWLDEITPAPIDTAKSGE